MGIYNEKKSFEKEIARVQSANISDENKNVILEFKSYLIATRIGILRTTRYVNILRQISERYNSKNYPDWTKKDVIETLEKIEMKDYSPYTKKEFDKTLKRFFKWNKGENWEGLEAIKGNRKINRKPDILTKDEVLSVIGAAKHPRNKAIVSLLYEGGFRIGELASIRFKDIEFNKFGGKVKVRGKTGERLVPFVISESFLKNWMQMHPCPKEDNSLFVSLSPRSYGKPLYYEMYNHIVKAAVNDAGIKKRISPHTLRHSRATHLASMLTESEMCHYLGWQLGSDMPRIYVHLSGRDIDNAIYNKVYGLDTGDKKEENIKPVMCPRCKGNCGPTSEFCYRCGMPLKEEMILKNEKTESEIRNDYLLLAQENPAILEDMRLFIEMFEIMKENPRMKTEFFKAVAKKR